MMCAFCFSACNEPESTSESKQPAIAFVNAEITIHVGDSVEPEIEVAKANAYIIWSTLDDSIAKVLDIVSKENGTISSSPSCFSSTSKFILLL